MILGLTLRLVWAVASAAWSIGSCAVAGHPKARWHWDDVRRCPCGRTWRRPVK